MRYMFLIISDEVATPEKAAGMEAGIPKLVEAIRDKHQYGHRLQGHATARTVRTRGGEVFVSDGPFAESKEWVSGFDVVECADLDEAISLAAIHPVSHFHAVEIRPLMEKGDFDEEYAVPGGLPPADLPAGRTRYLMLMCVNGVAEAPEEEAAIRRNSEAWGLRLDAEGAFRWGEGLRGVEAATTVRVRNGETLVTDGPFVEAKEFIGGAAVVDCESLEQAIAYAASHPIANYHRVEVRPFWEDGAEG